MYHQQHPQQQQRGFGNTPPVYFQDGYGGTVPDDDWGEDWGADDAGAGHTNKGGGGRGHGRGAKHAGKGLVWVDGRDEFNPAVHGQRRH